MLYSWNNTFLTAHGADCASLGYLAGSAVLNNIERICWSGEQPCSFPFHQTKPLANNQTGEKALKVGKLQLVSVCRQFQ